LSAAVDAIAIARSCWMHNFSSFYKINLNCRMISFAQNPCFYSKLQTKCMRISRMSIA